MRATKPFRENPPTVGAYAAVFAERLIHWAATSFEGLAPAEVITAGYALAVALAVVVIGRLTQTQTIPTDWIDAETVLRMREDADGDR